MIARKDNAPEAVRTRVVRKLRTDALEAAVDGLTRVLTDPKSPAPAVATAGVAVLRANSLLQGKEGDGSRKELHEMTADELRREIARMQVDQADMERALEEGAAIGDEPGEDVFG